VKILGSLNAGRPEFLIVEKDTRTDKENDDVAKRRSNKQATGRDEREKLPNGRNKVSATLKDFGIDGYHRFILAEVMTI
jgi:hypothetical protein